MKSLMGTGKVVQTTCNEVSIPEFPKLLFGTHIDGSRFFDATEYLLSKDPAKKLSVEDFFEKCNFQIQSVANTYEIKPAEIVLINKSGHQLINGAFCYPFLSYVDPQFCAYMNEVMDELFTRGVVLSDTKIIELAKERITPELAKNIWNGQPTMA